MRTGLVKALAISVAAVSAAGCATTSADVNSVYVSPLQYATYDCSQLAAETHRLQVRAMQLGGAIDERAKNANMATAAAVVLFWPAAFFTGGGNKEQQAELARMKGEQDAIQQAAIQRKCQGLVMQPEPASKPGAEAKPEQVVKN